MTIVIARRPGLKLGRRGNLILLPDCFGCTRNDRNKHMIIILISHILIALSGLAYTAYALFSPSRPKLRASYILLALTTISGTYLTVLKPVHITQTCETGLAYVGVMLVGIFAVRHKLATQSNN
jgi:hypothetical protein